MHVSVLDRHGDLPPILVDVELSRRDWPVPDWHEWALCGGMEFATFFGAAGDERPTMKRSEISTARAICSGCDVKRDCLDWALSTGEAFGVWGGTSGKQRARMRAAMKSGLSQADVVDGWFRSWLET